LLQQQLQVRSRSVHDHDKTWLNHIGIWMELIRPVQSANCEPVLPIRLSLEIEPASFGRNGLNMLPIEAVVSRQEETNLFGS